MTTVAAALLPLPLLWTSHPSITTKYTLLLAYALATAAIAAASFRTYLAHSTRLTPGPTPTFLASLASSIELSTSLTAALLPSLPSLLPSRRRPSTSSFSQITNHITHFTTKPPPTGTTTATLSTNASAPRYHSFLSNSSRYTYASTSTVLRHSSTTHTTRASGAVSAGRYHDNESNIEFELLTPTRARSRTTTLRSYPQSLRSYPQSLRSYPQSLTDVPVPHLDPRLHRQSQRRSRTASVWDEKEGLFVASPRREAAVSADELADRTSGIPGEGEGERGSRIGVALATLVAAPQLARLSLRGDEGIADGLGEGEDEEMAQLRRLFEDGDVQWGLPGSVLGNGKRLDRYRGVRI